MKGFKTMKRKFRNRWRPIASLIVSFLALPAFLSCQSSYDLPKFISGIDQTTTSKLEEGTMNMSQVISRIEHVNMDNFNEVVLNSKTPVLVDFYADWCGPCKALAPVLEEVARETPDAKIVKVNVDENQELAARYKIDSIPSLLVFKDTRLTDRHLGLADKAALKRLITRL
jgi:thioredoxin 1